MRKQKGVKNNIEEFYDSLADDYDMMTTFDQRFNKEAPLLRSLVKKYNIKNALDAGCGTGFLSIILAKLGVDVTAVDISTKMLEHLQRNAAEHHVRINTLHSSFQNLHKKSPVEFDAIFCTGNSLSHQNSIVELKQTIKNFYSIINRNGLLYIQILNYDRIMADKMRILNIKETKGKLFIRFYDFYKDFIQFNILRIERNGKKIFHNIQSTKLKPIMKNKLIIILKETGFKGIKIFGSFPFVKYSNKISRDLIVLARKIS